MSPAHTSKKNAQCPACSMKRAHLRREIRAAEKQERAGKVPSLDRINAVKADLAECAAAGHRDNSRSANARWHPERTA